MNITICKARCDDAGVLTDLIMRSKSSNGYDEAFMAACYDELAVTPERMARGEYWVADAGVLCGCASLSFDDCGTSGEVNAFLLTRTGRVKALAGCYGKSCLNGQRRKA